MSWNNFNEKDEKCFLDIEKFWKNVSITNDQIFWCQTVSKMRLKYYPLRWISWRKAKKRDWYHGWNKCLKNRIGDDVAGLKKKSWKFLSRSREPYSERDDDDRLHSFITGWFLVSQDLWKSSVTIHYFPFWWVLQNSSIELCCNPINHGFIRPHRSFIGIKASVQSHAKPKK